MRKFALVAVAAAGGVATALAVTAFASQPPTHYEYSIESVPPDAPGARHYSNQDELSPREKIESRFEMLEKTTGKEYPLGPPSNLPVPG